MDWKDILLAKSAEMGIKPADDTLNNQDSIEEDTFVASSHSPLHVVVERKGRAGKSATIIEGFECDEKKLKQIAAGLKSKLGTGGSARGGEILIQGDCKDKVVSALKTMGFKVKG